MKAEDWIMVTALTIPFWFMVFGFYITRNTWHPGVPTSANPLPRKIK